MDFNQLNLSEIYWIWQLFDDNFVIRIVKLLTLPTDEISVKAELFRDEVELLYIFN